MIITSAIFSSRDPSLLDSAPFAGTTFPSHFQPPFFLLLAQPECFYLIFFISKYVIIASHCPCVLLCGCLGIDPGVPLLLVGSCEVQLLSVGLSLLQTYNLCIYLRLEVSIPLVLKVSG
jgi:hypothetical protein